MTLADAEKNYDNNNNDIKFKEKKYSEWILQKLHGHGHAIFEVFILHVWCFHY